MKKHLLSIIASIVICALLLIGCGGGGGGGSSNNGNDLFKVINTVNKNISADSATQIGVLTSDGIQLNLSKGALSDNSNVAVRQYSNDAAMARFTENFPSLASFTVVSSLYELTAKDNKSKTLTVLEIPSEVEVALTEDLNTNKLYYAVVKQNGEWTLLPLQNNSSSNSSRLASNASRSIKMIFNTIYENLFIVAVTKKNATNSKLTYAEDFIISLNGSETSPQTITASYTQKFDNDIEASLRLTLKGDVSPDKAEISITALQNENKKISIKKSDKTYKDFDFTTAEQRGKYQTTFKLTSDLATSKLSGNTATYNFIIKAKDMKVSDMPTKLILKASVKGSSIFYSNDMQINFEKGADQPIIPEEPSTPDNPTKPEEPSTPEEPQIIVYTIKYDLDGGKLVKSNPQKYDTESDTITLNNPIKEGYTFVGWTGSNGNSPEKTVTIKTGSTGNKEFIANWNKNPADTFTVALIRGTGIATVKGDGAYKSGTKVTVSYTLENGYEFDKWSGDKTEASFTMPAKDVTMTANAKPITYNITYNLDGGSVLKANPSTYNVTTADIILNNPTKEGYSFVGWSGTGLTGNSNTKVTISKGSTGNKQFTANWNKIYTIKYDGNGNTSGTEPTDTIDSQTNIALLVSNYGTLAKGNYSFYAWNTKADGTGINVNPNEIITLSRFNELNINNKDYIILYAIWEKTKVSFELKSNKNNTDFDTINGKYRLNPNFTLLSSFAFKDSNSIQIIKDSIYITNVNNGNIKKEWDYNTNSLVIILEENLTEDTNYEFNMSNFSLEG
ncbi:MAG: InlB B-repeat-containing protein, partial [Candidatus Riflebacteria bacterium]|nr:InlB B-repeat-containing protein [Candidatus Riflebacteria bacterium]